MTDETMDKKDDFAEFVRSARVPLVEAAEELLRDEEKIAEQAERGVEHYKRELKNAEERLAQTERRVQKYRESVATVKKTVELYAEKGYFHHTEDSWAYIRPEHQRRLYEELKPKIPIAGIGKIARSITCTISLEEMLGGNTPEWLVAHYPKSFWQLPSNRQKTREDPADRTVPQPMPEEPTNPQKAIKPETS